MTITNVELTPNFDSATNNYTGQTESQTIKVNATPTSEQATVQASLNDEPALLNTDLTIDEGENTLAITVAGTEVNTYTVTITKNTAPKLVTLNITDTNLTPPFSPDTTDYEGINNGSGGCTVTATSESGSSITAKYNDEDITLGELFMLSRTPSDLIITVTNGTLSTEYTVTIDWRG